MSVEGRILLHITLCMSFPTYSYTACYLVAAQCIVIGPVCLCFCVCLWVCYHDNSKLCASILTKLGLLVKIVTISGCLNCGRPVPSGRGSAAG